MANCLRALFFSEIGKFPGNSLLSLFLNMKRSAPGTYPTYTAAKRSMRRSPYAPAPNVANRGSALVETKYFDTSFSNPIAVAADWTGTEVPCFSYVKSDGTTVDAYTDSSLIPSAIGSGYGQVNGSKYNLRKLRIKGAILPIAASDQADVVPATTVRLILVQDLQPNGTQAQGEDLFIDMGTSTQNNSNFLSMGSGSGGRFKIWKDKIFLLNPAVAATDAANTASNIRNGASFKFNLNFKKPIQVNLKANSAVPTTASLSNCNFFLLAHQGAGNCIPLLSGCARAYYND